MVFGRHFHLSATSFPFFLSIPLVHQTTKELGDFVRSAQKAKILKILVAVLLVFLLVWLLKEMCFQHLTISFLVKKVNHLNATKVALANEADYLKATNVALTKEIDGIKETNRAQAEYRREQLAKDSERNTTIQLRDVRKFLDSHEKEKLGESFRCSGLSWHLYFEKFSSWMENQLLVYVCHDKTDFFGYRFGDWSVSATFDLTMVNHGDKEKSKTLHFSNVFEKNSQYHCYGELFGAISDLYDGFVRDDAIDFKLQFNSLQLKLID